MIRKTYQLSDDLLEVIKEVREKNDFLENDSEALRYIITQYKKAVEREERAMESIPLILSIQKDNEQMIERLYDAINTILIEGGQELCYPASYMESPVYTKSRSYKKEKLAELKQKKNHRHQAYRDYKREKLDWKSQDATYKKNEEK